MDIASVHRELGLGDEGPEVEATFGYLKSTGYFPNPDLEVAHPYWAPIVHDLPDDASRFGVELEQAVRAFQGYAELPQTGRVDMATLAAMQAPRCGTPENGYGAADPSEKWALLQGSNPLWTKTNLTWKVTDYCWPRATNCSPPGVTRAQVDSAIDAAFQSWQVNTTLNFSKSNTTTQDIEIKFYSPGTSSRPPGWPDYNTAFNGVTFSKGQIAFNPSFTWTQALVQAVALHEIGHSLGLDHGGDTDPVGGTPNGFMTTAGTATQRQVMFFQPPTLSVLTNDEVLGISSRYSSWKLLSGLAVDVAVGGSSPTFPQTWVTSGAGTIWKQNFPNLTFTQDTGGVDGVSIAVNSLGRPCVVSSTNQVRCKASNDPSSGSWTANIAGADGGRDIGMGGPNDSTWIISNRSTGDGNFAVKRWNGGGFVEPVNPGSGVRITVDSAGHPWVVRVDHNVFVNETDDGTAQWTQIKNVTQGPEACATDIGAGRFGGLYITGCQTDGTNFDIWMLSKQFTTATPNDTARTVTAWWPLDGSATRIAVGPDARAAAVQGAGWIFVRNPR